MCSNLCLLAAKCGLPNCIRVWKVNTVVTTRTFMEFWHFLGKCFFGLALWLLLYCLLSCNFIQNIRVIFASLVFACSRCTHTQKVVLLKLRSFSLVAKDLMVAMPWFLWNINGNCFVMNDPPSWSGVAIAYPAVLQEGHPFRQYSKNTP